MTNSLNQRIAEFYDASTQLWEEIWSEHLHHGYYGRNGNYIINRRQAQIDLITELLSWANVQQPQTILDVGCGIGGSTLYLADKFNAQAEGVTLSPLQQQRATERAKMAKLDQNVKFRVANALELPYDNDSFDLVWSLESGEHMPDKRQFLSECYRVLQPGGKLVLATWCHRSTDSLAGDLTAIEQNLLKQLYQLYHLPYVISLPEYQAIAQDSGFQDIRVEDWSISVAAFWYEVVTSMLEPQAMLGLLRSQSITLQGALAVGLMIRGYQMGLIRFGLLTAMK